MGDLSRYKTTLTEMKRCSFIIGIPPSHVAPHAIHVDYHFNQSSTFRLGINRDADDIDAAGVSNGFTDLRRYR